ncbi:MAG: hypothetical protein DRP84_12550 [Spirochaetes bacterium]|nr:MAG: hypothetical protein DRP84_12550 [Spirochaetota bacterium]
MVILDKQKIYTSQDIAVIENSMLSGILACRTQEAVEAAITYARYLNKTGLTYENYPLFVKVLEIGNHWVIDALIGERDPFLFFSSIKPNFEILTACFGLLAERHPGGLYAKSLSVILGVLQATYNVPEDGYKIYPLTVSDVNSLGKHLDEEAGQEDSLNRVILDILDKISQLEGLEDHTRDMEEVAIHANEIRNYFYDATKTIKDVIPPVLLVRMDYRKFEVAPRKEVPFEKSKLYDKEAAAKSATAKKSGGAKGGAAAKKEESSGNQEEG